MFWAEYVPECVRLARRVSVCSIRKRTNIETTAFHKDGVLVAPDGMECDTELLIRMECQEQSDERTKVQTGSDTRL